MHDGVEGGVLVDEEEAVNVAEDEVVVARVGDLEEERVLRLRPLHVVGHAVGVHVDPPVLEVYA